MREKIQEQLREIEDREHVKILLAVESGSRAWGFASSDSDYDVRFIYVRRLEDYLKLDVEKDVIELPFDGVLDINGWDLQKALRLLHKSNPSLFEWFSSPIVYKKTDFVDKINKLMTKYFSSKKNLYHYISMAEGNYREYLKGDYVKIKKYFYVLRPVLACRWILDKGTPPPVLFSKLVKEELPIELTDTVNSLLDLKMNSKEIDSIPKISELNEYLYDSIQDIKNIVKSLDDSYTLDWDELNQLFLQELMNK